MAMSEKTGKLTRKDACPAGVRGAARQYRHFRQRFPGDMLFFQAGHHLLTLLFSGRTVTLISETGRLLDGVKERLPRWWSPS